MGEKTMSRLLLLCLASLLLSGYVFAQTPVAVQKQSDLAELKLEKVRIKKQTVGLMLSQLSLAYGIPIGLEIAPSDDQLGNYEFDFNKGTLSELLTRFVAEHNQYAWRIRDGVVNVFPREGSRDFLLQNLLHTKLSTVQVKENTNCSALAASLMATSELKRVLDASGVTYREPSFSGFFIPQLGRHFKLDVSDSTLQFVLNRVISESPTAKFWVLARNDDQTLFLAFGANHEDALPGKGFSEEDLAGKPLY